MCIQTSSGQSLFEAASQGDIELVLKLTTRDEARRDINERDDKGRSALHGAASGGHLDVVNLLLQYSAYVNIRDNEGQTALYPAATLDYIEIIEALLNAGIDSGLKNDSGRTAQDIAETKGHLDIVELLKNNVPPDQGDLFVEAAMHNDLALVKKYLIKGVSIHVRDGEGATAILGASIGGDDEMMRFLIDNGADTGEKILGFTPLYLASMVGRIEVVKVLIENNVNINAFEEEDGLTPLHIAAGFGYDEIVKLLVNNQASVDAKSFDGTTPLHLAAYTEANSENIVSFLLSNGSDINGMNNDGRAALHFAAQGGDLGTVQSLVANGANTIAKDNEGEMARDIADMHGYAEISQYLKSIEKD